MKKKVKFYFASPPNSEMVDCWKAFLVIGEEISKEMSTSEPELMLNEEKMKIWNKFFPDSPFTDSSSGEKELGVVVLHKNSLKNRPLQQQEQEKNKKWLSLLKKESAFPFLKEDIPFSARAAIAYLCYKFIDNVKVQYLTEVYKFFRVLEIPIEKHKEECEKLISYAHKNDLLTMIIVGEKPEFLLSKKAFEEILNIKVKDEFSIEPRQKLPFEEEMERKTLQLKNIKRAAAIPDTTISNLVLDKEAMLKIQFLVALKKKEPSSVFRILLWGPPGTGKTFTATAIAGELKKKLITLDLANILDKYVGETEKNLSSIFSQAEKEDAIILIDEADSYLKNRADTHCDWWANLVNHILKLLEKNKVSVILCTNLYENLDTALLRRMDEVIEYKIPTKEERFQIWLKEMEKCRIDKSNFDLNEVSNVEITGGLIANSVKKVHQISVVMGEKEKIDTQFLKILAEDEKKKMEIKVKSTQKRILGFGGSNEC